MFVVFGLETTALLGGLEGIVADPVWGSNHAWRTWRSQFWRWDGRRVTSHLRQSRVAEGGGRWRMWMCGLSTWIGFAIAWMVFPRK